MKGLRMARTLAALCAVAVAVTLVSAPHAARSSSINQYVAPVGSGALFLISGHGYGHGVGMGQWGAQGYALQGFTADQILAAYYPGTTAGLTTTTIRNLSATDIASLSKTQTAALTVTEIGALSGTQLSALSTGQMTGLTATQSAPCWAPRRSP